MGHLSLLYKLSAKYESILKLMYSVPCCSDWLVTVVKPNHKQIIDSGHSRDSGKWNHAIIVNNFQFQTLLPETVVKRIKKIKLICIHSKFLL